MSPGKRRWKPLKQANTEPRFQGIQTPKRSQWSISTLWRRR
jgi:hypothetical protein